MSAYDAPPATHRKAADALAIAGPPTWFVAFARVLHELRGVELDWLELLEKPWKWAPEYSAWCVNGHPDGPEHPRWADFAGDLAS